LRPGETLRVSVDVDPRLLADFDVETGGWVVAAGRYDIAVGASAEHRSERTSCVLSRRVYKP
jgi:beta-glucosidase